MESAEDGTIYHLVSPEGGWGYFVTVSVIFINIILLIHKVTFGLLFGAFLTSVGDATKITGLSIGIYNTTMSFTGIFASSLLRRYSYRKVGLLGSVIYLIGAIGLIFVQTEWEIYFYFGVLLGIGGGLTFPAGFTAMNFYFDKKLNFQIGVAKVFITVSAIGFPTLVTFLMKTIGFQHSVIVVVLGLALINFPAMWVLHPVKWHMQKKIISTKKSENQTMSKEDTNLDHEIPFIESNKEEQGELTRRQSVHSVGDRPLAIIPKEKNKNTKLLDFSLFRDIRFLNVSTGLSLSFSSDVAFYTMIPVLLSSAGFNVEDQATMSTVFYVCDCVSRLLFTIFCYFFTVRNRYVFLGGTLFSAMFRIAFTARNDYTWRITMLGILGFFRAYIQVPYPLVISDEYKDNFGTAFSLTMFVSGIINLIIGPLMSYVKTVTQNDVMVSHVLTVSFLICVVSWTIEFMFDWLNNKKKVKSIRSS